MITKDDSTIKEQQKQIEELREKILMERLNVLHSTVHRIEEMLKKTYEQATITNGRVTKLEEANLIDRIRHIESQIVPINFMVRNRKSFITAFFVLYIIAISPIGQNMYDAIVQVISNLNL